MKTKLHGLFLALLSVVVFTACDNDDDDLRLKDVPTVVVDSFETQFPNAGRAEWESQTGYLVVDFWLDGIETHAWYNRDGKWQMTESDLDLNLKALPQTVQDAFQSGQYAAWTIDNIDKYERPADVFYLIEVETAGQQDRKLFYDPEGILLRDEPDRDNDDVTPDISF